MRKGGTEALPLYIYVWFFGEKEATRKKSLFFVVCALSCLCLLRFRDPRPARDTVVGGCKRCDSTQGLQANDFKVRDLSTVSLEGGVYAMVEEGEKGTRTS